jgi:hypothetical protein
VAAGVGYCGLDPRRLPLTGRELRGCWTAADVRDDLPAPVLESDWAAKVTLFGEREA